ncbi:hypothetical protein ACF0H5_002792 [Mactra antiquata]
MPQYKLTYFKTRGAAELSRLVFTLAGEKYVDERLEREEWQKVKHNTPLEALPVLEVDGVVVSQSAAIARFLARRFKLFGKTDMEEFAIDEAHEVFAEIFNRELMKIFYESDATKKAEIAKAFIDGSLQKYLTFFETRLKKNGTGFYVGNELTFGDLIIYNGLTMTEALLKMTKLDLNLASCPELAALIKRVEENPRIAKWIAERPKTDM